MNTGAYVVFGAAGGVGSALVQRLALAGLDVVACGWNESRLAPLATETGAHIVLANPTDWSQIEHAMEEAAAHFGRVAGIANCVGSLLLNPARGSGCEEFREVIDLNLASAFGVVRAAGTFMRNQGGSVVLISPAAATRGLRNHKAITATKAGIVGLAHAAAATYAARGIRVNCLTPGLTDASAHTSSGKIYPLERLRTPEDLASAAHWLLNPESAWVTGQTLGVDGGLAATG